MRPARYFSIIQLSNARMRWGLRHISTVFLFLPNMKVKNRMYFFLISYSFIVISGGTVYNRISKNRMRSFSNDSFL